MARPSRSTVACTWSDRSTKHFAAITGAAAIFFAAVAYGYVLRYRIPIVSAIGIYACFFTLLILLLIPAFFPHVRMKPAVMGIFLCPYLLYAAATNDFRWLALGKLLALLAIPVAVFALFPVKELDRFTWQDAVAWLWLTLPIVLRQETGIWTKPVNLDFMARLFTIGVAAWCWIFLRGALGTGYCFTISPAGLRVAVKNFVLFSIIAIPLGFLFHLAAWNPRWRGFWSFCVDYITIFLFIAWLEEFFFRGILQNLLTKNLKSPIPAQLLASVAFGLSHILLAPAPNWRYVILASIAGWFYGSAFRESGTLMPAAMMHAFVDTVWRTWFARGMIS
jgi:membrane protease YdiL (CAAX protease family)